MRLRYGARSGDVIDTAGLKLRQSKAEVGKSFGDRGRAKAAAPRVQRLRPGHGDVLVRARRY